MPEVTIHNLILLEMSELEDSIESSSNLLSNSEEHSDLISTIEDLPTPPYRAPLREGDFNAKVKG